MHCFFVFLFFLFLFCFCFVCFKEFAQAVVKKNGVDALLDALKSTENGDALALICFIFSILSEVDAGENLLICTLSYYSLILF